MRLTEEQIEAGRSAKGGWTRKKLAAWGVPWPPPHGWRWRLVHGRDVRNPALEAQPPEFAGAKPHIRRKTSAADFPNIPLARFYFSKPKPVLLRVIP
jgi:hypothetical protein